MLYVAILTIIMLVFMCFSMRYYIKLPKDGKMFFATFAIQGLSLLAIGYRLNDVFGNIAYTYLFIVFYAILLVLAAEDALTKQIDKYGVITLLAIGFLTSFAVPEGKFWILIITATAIAGVASLFSLKSNEAVGRGDVLCLAATTLCFKINELFLVLFYAFFFCLIYSVVLLIQKKIDKKQGIPFVPFLAFGMLVHMYMVTK